MSSFCENKKCYENDILLEEYKDIDQGKLLICPECSTLYYHNTEIDVLSMLREEPFLISNIDSPIKNSEPCKCGNLMHRASDWSDSGYAWYYCLNCNHMYFKSMASCTSE